MEPKQRTIFSKEGNNWNVVVENGSNVVISSQGSLDKKVHLEFNKGIREAITYCQSRYCLISDNTKTPTHNGAALDYFRTFFEKLKVTKIQKLAIIVANQTARLKVTRVAKESYLNFPFIVVESLQEAKNYCEEK